MSKVVQQFDGDYNFTCIGCDKTIAHDDLYIEVRQRDFQDSDSRLACHLHCLTTDQPEQPHPSARVRAALAEAYDRSAPPMGWPGPNE